MAFTKEGGGTEKFSAQPTSQNIPYVWSLKYWFFWCRSSQELFSGPFVEQVNQREWDEGIWIEEKIKKEIKTRKVISEQLLKEKNDNLIAISLWDLFINLYKFLLWLPFIWFLSHIRLMCAPILSQ